MKVAKNTVVSVRYVLSDAQGSVIEEGTEPMNYLHGGYENTLPKIEEALDGQDVGYETMIQVEPDDAFGEYDANLIKIEDRSRMPAEIAVGMQLEGAPEDADEETAPLIFTITDIEGDKVVLDGNHPLAGMALRFNLKIESVREASAEELEHGHVHGEHGHHHDHVIEAEDDDHFRSYPLQ